MKITLKILGVFYLLNGLLMLTIPEIWYRITPGAAHSGAMNVHFIRDIGLAFCAASLWALWPRFKHYTPIIFIGGHGILHAVEFFDGHFSGIEILRDSGLIILPALAFCLIILKQEKK
ncbi:MAG: hypothetical protein COB13_006970 [OCS116 cluster bacterium]|nr:hypothetical protein [OCS116 cluster bacterium]